ncbi:MAG: acyl-CoA thioesterase [Candidatus Fermentibacteraceae bacterium]
MDDGSPAGGEHRVTMTVRDYECDVQGIVNNAVYLNYLEHARHRHLLSLGVDFVEMAGRGLNMVVTRMELDYRRPLRAGDAFTVTSSMSRVSRLRFRFDQSVELEPGAEEVLRAVVLGTVVDEEGRPVMPPELDRLDRCSERG